jgi:hypothetical protein
MSKQITVGFLDGEITDVTSQWMTSQTVEGHFSVGDVYVYTQEPHGMQWRVLQRSTRINATTGTYAALLPCKAEQVPEIVRMVALMRE